MSQAITPIHSVLISVYHKEGLETLARILHSADVQLYSTGGTQTWLESLGLPVIPVEDITHFPSIFGGRVKTLHPKIFGGILQRRDKQSDRDEALVYKIPTIDLVVVDLYPFEATVAAGLPEEEIIEKIDIGGISLIRAAAKNFQDVTIISHQGQYQQVEQWIIEQGGLTLDNRRQLATQAFATSSHYDTAIFNYFNTDKVTFRASVNGGKTLRYGENPHQRGWFYGNLDEMLVQLNGKELSYNNLVDIDAAINLINEFQDGPTFGIIKHTNACGLALGERLVDAYTKAFAADPISAFGGVLIANQAIDLATAEAMHSLFFEVLIAPKFDAEALALLSTKKNRLLIEAKHFNPQPKVFKSILNGVLAMDQDLHTDEVPDLKYSTTIEPTPAQVNDLLIASKICKHSKSNTIILVKDGQLLGSGVGQTSRVDALNQAIHKAKSFGFSIEGAAMASDAFFPFPDCVQIAYEAGIGSVIQPGGSIKDQESIDYCNSVGLPMVLTGYRHFKH
jgi:phosphoribosylaminoimidazolecarboxamide formyltransferase/IMP cyclohydrolase